MRIRDARVHSVHVPLKEPYTIAYETISEVTNHYLILTSEDGESGIGCAAPAPEVTGETVEQARQALTTFSENVIGKDVDADGEQGLPSIPLERPSARAALDLAVHDLEARSRGVNLGELLGRTSLNADAPGSAGLDAATTGKNGRDATLPTPDSAIQSATTPRITSVTIGISSVDETLARANTLIEDGFTFLKIKGGHNAAIDIQRLLRLRERWGSELILALDGNQGYSLEDVGMLEDAQSDVNLVYLEQPTPKRDLAMLSEAGRRTRIPVMADESAQDVESVERLAELGAVSLVNIKLQKMGGLAPSVLIDEAARKGGMKTMLGCMDESALSIAAALYFAQAHPNVAYLDLDGHFDLMQDPFEDLVSLDEQGRLSTNGAAGLGWTSVPELP